MKTKIVALVLAAALLLSAVASVQGAYSYDGSTFSELARPVNETGREPLPQQNVTPTPPENETAQIAISADENYTVGQSREMRIEISDPASSIIQDTSADVTEATSYGPSSPVQEPPEEENPAESIEVPGQASETAPPEMDVDDELSPVEESKESEGLPVAEKHEESQEETKPNVFVRLAKFFRSMFG